MNVELRPHQKKAVEELDSGKILCGGVGVGKSITSIAYFVTKEKADQLYIITTARKRDSHDWDGECAHFNVKPTVDSWNNIHKYIGIKDAFFIFDEQRLVGSGAWVRSFYKIAKANRWILLSATPGDTWMDYIPVFVANGFYKNKTAFTRTHAVFNAFTKFPKVDHFVGERILRQYRDKLLVDMPFVRSTTRHDIQWPVLYDKLQFDMVLKSRWNPFTHEPIKDVSELFACMRKVTNSDPSRLQAVREILKKRPKLIVFYNFDYELEVLRTLPGVVKEWNGHKHEPVPKGDAWVYLVQYSAGAEAWNCITTDTILFYSLNYSYRIREQAMGRIDRLNTPYKDLYYYTLKSGSKIDIAIYRALKMKKTFNEHSYLAKRH